MLPVPGNRVLPFESKISANAGTDIFIFRWCGGRQFYFQRSYNLFPDRYIEQVRAQNMRNVNCAAGCPCGLHEGFGTCLAPFKFQDSHKLDGAAAFSWSGFGEIK